MKNAVIAVAAILLIIIVIAALYLATYTVNQGLYTGPLVTPSQFSSPACALPLLLGHTQFANYSGFSVYNVSGLEDYVIAPGNNGTIFYSIALKWSTSYTNSTYNSKNISSRIWFFYNASNHAGNNSAGPINVLVSYKPSNATLMANQSALFNYTFYVTRNAAEGTYLMEFPPGICDGGQLALLTIGTRPYNGTLHLILPP